MIRRVLSFVFLVWVIGFLWFVVALPPPAQEPARTDAVIVLTPMRIPFRYTWARCSGRVRPRC